MEDETTPETPEMASFTSVDEFDARIAELKANPVAANLSPLADAIEAKVQFEAGLAAVAAAEEAAAAALESPDDEADEPVAEIVSEDVVEDEPEVVADPELIAASVAVPAAPKSDPTPTGGDRKTRKAQVRHVLQHSSVPLESVKDIEKAFRGALGASGTIETVLEFPRWDREEVGEENVLKATNTAQQNDRIMGVVDADGNPLSQVRDFRANVARAGARIHRASCDGCDGCGGVLETPDCFVDYGEPLGDCFDAVAADSCSYNVQKQQTLADLDQQVYLYCPPDDADGNPQEPGIYNAETDTVTPIDPDDPSTWKAFTEIKTSCGDKTKYGLEEFPLLFTIDRKTDKCAEDGAVIRTLNRYFALQSRFMEARKMTILGDWATNNGFGAALAAPSGVGLEYDFGSLLSTAAAAISAQAGVDALEGFKLAVPAGMTAWAECASPGIIDRLADKHGLAGLVEVGGTGPYSDPKAYPVGVDAEGVPAPKIPVEPLAEALKTWEFVAFDPTQWVKPVDETVRIGMTDTFRDFNLARQNKRGIVIYRDEALIPVGCVPSVCFEGTMCNVPLLPARSAITGC